MSLGGTLIVVAWFAATFASFRAHPALGVVVATIGGLAALRFRSRIRRATLDGATPSPADRTRLMVDSARVSTTIIGASAVAGALPLALAAVAVASDVGVLAFAAIVFGPVCGVLLAMSTAGALVRRLW